MTIDYITINDSSALSKIDRIDNMVVYLGGCCDDSNWKSTLRDSLMGIGQSIEKGSMTLVDSYCGDKEDHLDKVEFNEKVKNYCDLLIFNLCCEDICPLTMFEIGVWAKQYNLLVLVNGDSPIYNELRTYQKLYGFDVFDTDDPNILRQYVLNRFLKKVPQKIGLDSYMQCYEMPTCCGNAVKAC